MDEEKLWAQFTQDGRIDDYLAYRKHLAMQQDMELDLCDENQCRRLSYPGGSDR